MADIVSSLLEERNAPAFEASTKVQHLLALCSACKHIRVKLHAVIVLPVCVRNNIEFRYKDSEGH